MAKAWCGTSTRSLLALRMLSLRCLLGDGLRGEGLGIPLPLLGCHHISCATEAFTCSASCALAGDSTVQFFDVVYVPAVVR